MDLTKVLLACLTGSFGLLTWVAKQGFRMVVDQLVRNGQDQKRLGESDVRQEERIGGLERTTNDHEGRIRHLETKKTI